MNRTEDYYIGLNKRPKSEEVLTHSPSGILEWGIYARNSASHWWGVRVNGLGKRKRGSALCSLWPVRGVHRKLPCALVRVWREAGRTVRLAEAWSWEKTFNDRRQCQVTKRQQWIPLFTKRSNGTSFPARMSVQTKPPTPWQDKLRQITYKLPLSPGDLISFSPTQRNLSVR